MQAVDQASTIDRSVGSSLHMHEVKVKRELGAGPFVTFRHLVLLERDIFWLARNHRRGLGQDHPPRPFWQWQTFNILMGLGFAFGSVLFALGAVMSLFPKTADLVPLTENVAIIYFAGSIFFTCAAYMQLFQSANSAEEPVATNTPGLRAFLGWGPNDAGWLSSAAQFAGTLFFNVSTYSAIQGGSWLRQDTLIWGPDILGSLLFLFSGYLALVETCHKWWAWRPRTLAWWIVMVNFAGCVAFMFSAIFAFVPAAGLVVEIVNLSTFLTLVGAAGFFIGALLAIYESTSEPN